ncbi:MAG: CHASE3 domain-containing protein [Proteobacteria bacterium]|nr:CHASE3 domain-containing protein [Pseudomonadota bacterium]
MSEAALKEVRAERTFSLLVIGAVVLGFLTLVGVALVAVSVMARNLTYTEWVAHTYQVDTAIADFRTLDERIETARRGYLLSHDERFVDGVNQLKTQIQAQATYLRKITADNPRQQANIASLEGLMAQQFKAIDVSIAFSRSGADDASQFFNDTGVESTRLIRELTVAMQDEEKQLLTFRNSERLSSVHWLVVISIAAGLLLLFVALGSVFVILRYTRALAASRRELQRLNAGLEDEVATRTSDLQRANDEIQRFAYIVSHDLRSPLVNIMGFTSELEAAAKPLGGLLERAEAEAPAIVAEDARAAVRVDLPEAIGFIRASTRKMDRLINAILQLSRQGRRVLAPEVVDMNALLVNVAGSLQHRANELGAEVIIAPNLPSVFSDRVGLEQIFSNLMENALKYLKPGRPGRIEVSGQARDGRVIYEVRDNGRGVDPKDHERIFDLFRRAGAQDQPGEGIGLANVRAVAYRLGGSVSVQSGLDQGSTFRVSLPFRLTTSE